MGTVVRGARPARARFADARLAEVHGGSVATAATLVSATDPDRVLPVIDPLADVLPARGLVRGQVVACVGPAAPTIAIALISRASASGSWLALIGVPWLGVEAAREMGVVLERTVAVEVDPRRHAAWAEALVAAADGFELLVTTRDETLPDRVLRQVRTRVRSRGGVLVTLPVPGRRAGSARTARPTGPPTSPPSSNLDLVLTASTEAWSGLGCGHGRIGGRRLHVEVAGRRMPRPNEVVLEIAGGRLGASTGTDRSHASRTLI